MSVITQNMMHTTIVENVIDAYIKQNQMFTVYQIWSDACFLNKSRLDYNNVRNVVESKINDGYSFYTGWTRSVGYHLNKLDNNVGNVGNPPQIYHPRNAKLLEYDPSFRMYNKLAEQPIKSRPGALLVKNPIKARKIKNGLFKFKVWVNGSLINCSLTTPRGNRGRFVASNDYEGYGVLDDGSSVIVKQDNDGKLYAVKN